MKFKTKDTIKEGDKIMVNNKYGLRIIVEVLEIKEDQIINGITYKTIKVKCWTGKEFYTTTKSMIDAL